ncbi:hypothetical protein PFISCL1PPCAC_4407, partial [Pristionchus fissidentatus]
EEEEEEEEEEHEPDSATTHVHIINTLPVPVVTRSLTGAALQRQRFINTAELHKVKFPKKGKDEVFVAGGRAYLPPPKLRNDPEDKFGPRKLQRDSRVFTDPSRKSHALIHFHPKQKLTMKTVLRCRFCDVPMTAAMRGKHMGLVHPEIYEELLMSIDNVETAGGSKTDAPAYDCYLCHAHIPAGIGKEHHMHMEHTERWVKVSGKCQLSVCDYRSMDVELLIRHNRTFHDTRPFDFHHYRLQPGTQCPYCPTLIVSLVQLNTHISVAHKMLMCSRIPTLICSSCGFMCARVYEMIHHWNENSCVIGLRFSYGNGQRAIAEMNEKIIKKEEEEMEEETY